MLNVSLRQLFVVLGMAAGVAGAQIATPPPAEKPAEPAATPEAQPAARPAAQPAAKPKPKNSQQLQELPTNIPYPKLAQVGADGKIVRLKQLPDILALRANPTVGEKSVDEIMPVLYGRRARFEMLVIENLDLYWALTAGAIENLDMSNLPEMSKVAEMIKPLVGKTTLSEELQNRGILTRTQGGLNEYIVREYKQAISDEIQASEGQNGLSEFMRFILQDSIQEAELAYLGMMAEIKNQIPAMLEKTGISNPALAAQAGPLSTDVHEAEAQIHAVDQAFRTLSVDDGIRVLEALRNGRDNPNISPTITRINVLHDGKVMYEGPMGFKAIKGNELPLNTDGKKGKKKQEAGDQPASGAEGGDKPAQDGATPQALAPVSEQTDIGC